jgi:hypothetical protein
MPFLLDDDLLTDLLAVARTHIDRLDPTALRPQVSWRSTSSSLVRTPKWQSGRAPQREGRPSDRST